MVYESNLLRLVKSEAETEAAAAAAAAAEPAGAAASSSSSSSSSSSRPGTSSASALMSMRSADPSPLPRTPLTPASLLAEEERALKFERLAKLFFDERNVEMAKSYALKAIQIRRKIKGPWRAHAPDCDNRTRSLFFMPVLMFSCSLFFVLFFFAYFREMGRSVQDGQ